MAVRLTPTQRRVVEHGEGALLVVAGPGSGKTRVLTERVRRLLTGETGHFRVLALTFTNKAANEMMVRLDDLPDIRKRAFVGTLHSFCMEVLANRGKQVGIDGLPSIFESADDRRQVLMNAVASDPALSEILRAEGDQRARHKLMAGWMQRISELKNALVLPEMVEDEDERRLYEAYDSEMRASGAIDYDDLLLLTYRLFIERPAVAQYYQRQFRYICIDEGQDLNEAQYRVLTALCAESYRNVMIVGDPKQAIYVWNGADPKYLDAFVRDFNADRIVLHENFRCSKAVVAAARRLNRTYVVEGQPAVEGGIQLNVCEDEAAEARIVVERLEALLLNGHPDVEGQVELSRCAVLARNRFVFAALEQELADRNIPFYRRLSGSSYQSESKLVEQFELALRLLANPRDRLHRDLLVREWAIDGDPDQHKVDPADPVESIRRLAGEARAGWAEQVVAAVEALQWTSDSFKFTAALGELGETANSVKNESERALILRDVAEWRSHWNAYVRSEAGGSQSLGAFLGQVALGATQGPSEHGLALLTVHSAKGMEFDVVFLIGLAEGVFPDYRATGASMEEERRSAFVAVTRSKRLLYLSFPRSRVMPWGDRRRQDPSRFLKELLPAQLDRRGGDLA